MQPIIKIIKQYRQNIGTVLSKNMDKTKPVIDLLPQLESWVDAIEKNTQLCMKSIDTDLAPCFNKAYDSEAQMLDEIKNAFQRHSVHSAKLSELFYDIQHHYSHDIEEESVINALASSVKSILKDLQIFYINIEDTIQNNPKAGKINFAPDISAPFKIIDSYIAKQRLLIEHKNNKLPSIKPNRQQSCLLPLLTGLGLGVFMSDDNDSDC